MTAIEAVESMRLKFTSGNEVPVTQAQITAEEWEAICGDLARLAEQNDLFDAQTRHQDGLIVTMQAENEALRRRVAELIHYPDCWDTVAYPELKNALDNIDADYQGCTECAEKAIAKIKADAVREAIAAVDTLDISGMLPRHKVGFCACIDELEKYANQIEGGE